MATLLTAPPPAVGKAASAPAADDIWTSELWLETWWEVFGAGSERYGLQPASPPNVHWPLYRERYRLRRRVALLGNDYCRHHLACPDRIPDLVAALAGRRDWDELMLTGLPVDQAHLWLERLAAAGLPARIEPGCLQRYVALDRPWAEVEADFRPTLLSNVRRRERALRRLAPLELRVQTEPAGLDKVFEACLRLEASGWKGERGTAMISRPESRRFYTLLTHRAAAAGALYLSQLYSGEVLIAFSLGLRGGRALAGVKIAYLDSWRRYAPGTILKYLLLRRLHAARFTEMDLGGGDAPYKADWTPYTRALASLHAYNRTLPGRAAAALARTRAAWRGWRATRLSAAAPPA